MQSSEEKTLDMSTPLSYIKGVGQARASLLQSELGLYTAHDLLHYFPFRYIDKTSFVSIKDLNPAETEVQLKGKILSVKTVTQKRGSRLVASFTDGTGRIDLVWFRAAKWIKDSLSPSVTYVVYGKVNHFNGTFSLVHPDMEPLNEYEKNQMQTLQPVYHSTDALTRKGITNKIFSKIVRQFLVDNHKFFKENLSEELMKSLDLVGKTQALVSIHFPKTPEHHNKAQKRLVFEELFFIQLELIRKKIIKKYKSKGFVFDNIGNHFNDFYKNGLPFELTGAQKKVLKEIRTDTRSGSQMNRLLQGDVGSGKTIVALITMLIAIDSGFQATLIAPTEILANQHYNSIKELVDGMDINVNILTGSSRIKQRRVIHAELESGELNILIGTHAIFEDKVKFQNLGISIIDEQHRFGVAQRSKMWKKNTLAPHVLVMTATPIPRTLAMSVYGDLEVSVIDELPPGRKEIKTLHRYDSNRLAVWGFLKKEIEKGRQVYLVYPLIEESSKMDYKDLMDGYESICRDFPQPKYQISMVHGKMKAADKDLEMGRFQRGETQIMVATTVIEVGVNVPNASVMVIESTERFGLSQLHQLRGRVGRGAEQSYCVLMSSFKLSEQGKTRINTMVETNDGFKISEVDLKLRGPGNLMGTQQSGVLDMKIADIVRDANVLITARQEAIKLLDDDPNFEKEQNKGMRKGYIEMTKKSSEWSEIS